MLQYLVRMLTTIAHTTCAKLGDLPAIVLVDLSNRYLELVAYTCYHRFYNLPFFFQRMTLRQMKCNFADTYHHSLSNRALVCEHSGQASGYGPAHFPIQAKVTGFSIT